MKLFELENLIIDCNKLKFKQEPLECDIHNCSRLKSDSISFYIIRKGKTIRLCQYHSTFAYTIATEQDKKTIGKPSTSKGKII